MRADRPKSRVEMGRVQSEKTGKSASKYVRALCGRSGAKQRFTEQPVGERTFWMSFRMLALRLPLTKSQLFFFLGRAQEVAARLEARQPVSSTSGGRTERLAQAAPSSCAGRSAIRLAAGSANAASPETGRFL